MSLRQQLISDIADGDLSQRKGVGPCERIRGLARAPDLVRALKRLSAGVNSASVSMTVTALDKALAQASGRARALPAADRARICLLAVIERLDPLCHVCRGRREVRPPGGAVIRCEDCHGSGLRRYTDEDRIRIVGHRLTPPEELVLAEASSLYGHHDVLGDVIAEEAIYG
jgi:hypothetical protein